VFVELVPLLKLRTLLMTVAIVDEKLKVNVIPAKAKEGEDQALTSPLCFTGSAEELDAELGKQLVSYVEAHLGLTSTLAEAKAEMEAAAKSARQRMKSTQATKADPSATKKEDPALPVTGATETTPSLFSTQPQVEESSPEAGGEGRKTTL
jgi:PRTRC genetic system protein E